MTVLATVPCTALKDNTIHKNARTSSSGPGTLGSGGRVLTAEAGGKRVGCRVDGCWQTGAMRVAATRGRYPGYLDVDDDLGLLPCYRMRQCWTKLSLATQFLFLPTRLAAPRTWLHVLKLKRPPTPHPPPINLYF